MTVAQTIRKEINKACRSAFALWAATHYVEQERALRFKVKARRRCFVMVTYDAARMLYDVSFGVARGRNATWVEHTAAPGVAAEALFSVIDGYVS